MKNINRIHKTALALWVAFLLSACNFNAAKPNPATAAATLEISATLPGNSAGSKTPAVTATAIAAGPTANPCAASADGTLKLCFLDLADGQTLAAKPGAPFKIAAQASGATVSGISLSADLGGYAQFVPNTANTDPFRAEFSWTPGLGAGLYQLTLVALTPDKSESASGTISVTVTGLASTPPTPTLAPGAVYPDVIRKIQAAYIDLFKLGVKAPAIARKFRPGAEDPWVSTAYIGNVLYDVELFADGHIESWATPVFPNTAIDLNRSYFKEPVCRPAGTYSMLVVFLDFGNLKVGKDELLADLASATADANARYSAYPSAESGSAPILQIHTTGVVIPVPDEVKGKLITPIQIKKFTGVDPSTYQWIAQVDLDSASTFRYAAGQTTEATSFGYAFHGCPTMQSQPNIQITIDAAPELQGTGIRIDDNRLTGVMLGHEVYHLFGYPASHSWACTSGPQIDRADNCGISDIPALLLGWMDTDGDGVPEIMDSTPYGIVSP